jgi:hypothetical protein
MEVLACPASELLGLTPEAGRAAKQFTITVTIAFLQLISAERTSAQLA